MSYLRHMFGSYNLGNSGQEITAATYMVERLATELDVPQWSDKDMDFLRKPQEKGW